MRYIDPIHRRVFLREGALALLALGAMPDFLARPLLAAHVTDDRPPNRKKTLICIFQRGAADGLSMVVPFGDEAYYRARRNIAIPSPSSNGKGAIDLDGFYGLHPSLSPLRELYERGEMAIVHAVGSPNATRSHFDAQDFMELGTAGRHASDGWLNRVLEETRCDDCDGRTLASPERHALDHATGQMGMGVSESALRGIAVGGPLPLSLKGDRHTFAISDLDRFGLGPGRGTRDAVAALYSNEGLSEVAGDGADARGALEAARIVESISAAGYEPAGSASYPRGPFGTSLRQIAQMIKADVGVEIAFADLGGWDTHVGQGGTEGALARQLGQLGGGIRALYDDLGDRMEDIVILTMSEFGRTVAENGSGGTDHGHANCLFAVGGSIDGGRVLGDWPGLAREQLYEGRDLAVTTDFRDVFAEIAGGHLGVERLGKVFPDHEVRAERFAGVLR